MAAGRVNKVGRIPRENRRYKRHLSNQAGRLSDRLLPVQGDEARAHGGKVHGGGRFLLFTGNLLVR
jgi:hypothetical protein